MKPKLSRAIREAFIALQKSFDGDSNDEEHAAAVALVAEIEMEYGEITLESLDEPADLEVNP